MGADSRIGRQFLNAGLGFGGFCFPKDLAAFEALSRQLGYDFGLLGEIAKINEEAVEVTVQKVKTALWNLESKKIALWGLAFKPDTDDTRLSPALALARRLIDEGAHVVGYDPAALQNAKADVPDLDLANDAFEAATDAHCLVVATEWDEFLGTDLARLKEAMAYPVVIDARNLFDPEAMREAGFTYFPVGRPSLA
jgi:UDPglucose 6-dehydrogenase